MQNLDALSKEEKIQLLEVLEEKDRRTKQNKIKSYFCNTGKLRRELYKQHTKFFSLGKEYLTRAFMAANRVGKCITAETIIQHPNGEETTAGELYKLNRPFPVMSWDGEKAVESIAIEGIKKPAEECYRVWLSNGQWFDCAGEHRLLTESGWLFFSDLMKSLPCLPPSNSELGLLTRVEDVLNYFETTEDSQYDYLDYLRLYGGQLPHDLDIAQAEIPLLSDALLHDSVLYDLDVQENIYTNNHQLKYGRPSIQDDPYQSVGHYVELKDQGVYTFVEQKFDCSPINRQLSLESFSLLQLDDVISLYQSLALVSPYESNSIIAYQSIGCHDIYDFTVPKYGNYIAAGVVHHNTEGGGGYEVTCHLTGEYPDWWDGYRFSTPTEWWVAGDTNETVRNITQYKLLGDPENIGTGLIPKRLLGDIKYKQNSNGTVDYILVKHISGGWSRCAFKSYEQGRISFQGTEKHGIWLDEEAPAAVRSECIMRLMTTKGLLIETFTPLKGLTPVVMQYMSDSMTEDRVYISNDRAMVMAGWDDVPHLDEETKARMLDECEPHLRDARSKGIPQLGAGAIYPVQESDILIDDFEIPKHWKKCFALDVGWKRTASLWGALDPETDVLYLYSEHYMGNAEPIIHAQAIKSRGEWIRGVIDPASRGRSQVDGTQLLTLYQNMGLDLTTADNSVEAGIYEVWTRLSSGRLKVFKSLPNFLFEFRIYRRNEKGKIHKENDHLMDCLRYLVMSGLEQASLKPVESNNKLEYNTGYQTLGWLG